MARPRPKVTRLPLEMRNPPLSRAAWARRRKTRRKARERQLREAREWQYQWPGPMGRGLNEKL